METAELQGPEVRWTGIQAYALAIVCLVVGSALGYLIHGPAKLALANGEPSRSAQAPARSVAQMPTPEQMKAMADKRAEPLLQELKSKPHDPELLSQTAKVYFSAHQFSEAISYAERAVQAAPQQVGVRADLASYLFYSGDSDKAISTLQETLKIQPDNAQVLFNLGMMKLQAKDDRAGAIQAWKQLLKTNPNLAEDRRKAVQQAIAAASAPSKPAR